MILEIKKIIYILFITLGFFYFYAEYEKLRKNEYNYSDIKILKKEVKYSNTENKNFDKNKYINKNNIQEREFKNELNQTEIIVSKGDTLYSILKNFNYSDKKIYEILNKIEDFYDVKTLKVNDRITYFSNDKGDIKTVELSLNIDSILKININDTISVEKVKLKVLSDQKSYQFIISKSLYSDGLKNDLPQEVLIKLIKLFSFDIDFQRDIKKDTLVSVSYEFDLVSRNNKIKYNDINYALISIGGKKLEYFKFLTDDGFVDYFNREGKNVKKSILKTPLDGARLSSSFGMRKHPISGYNKMHKGVDFAAPKGTPIYAGGNGVIEYAGNNGGYGKYIRIRHNNEYKTAYAHLSAFKKGISKGARVNQGEIIGFVGSTGKSTGPHLHYEIIYQGKQINPLKLKLPSGKVLQNDELKRFKKELKSIYATHLHLLYE